MKTAIERLWSFIMTRQMVSALSFPSAARVLHEFSYLQKIIDSLHSLCMDTSFRRRQLQQVVLSEYVSRKASSNKCNAIQIQVTQLTRTSVILFHSKFYTILLLFHLYLYFASLVLHFSISNTNQYHKNHLIFKMEIVWVGYYACHQ